MVLKRKLPSKKAAADKQDAVAKTAAPQAENDVVAPPPLDEPFVEPEQPVAPPPLPDEAPEVPPLAPESQVESAAAIVPPLEEEDDGMVMSAPAPKPTDAPSFADEDISGNGNSSWGVEPVSAPASGAIKNTSPSGNWQIDDLIQPEASKAPAEDSFSMDKGNDPISPPWKEGKSKSSPKLPGGEDDAHGKKPSPEGIMPKIIVLVVIAVIGVGGYSYFVGDDARKGAEKIARLTGSLTGVTEELPEKYVEALHTDEDADTAAAGFSGIGVKAETDAAEQEIEEISLDDVEESEGIDEDKKNSAVVEFIDVPDEEVDDVIDGAEDAEMPEEMSLLAKVQKALADARDKKEKETLEDVLQTEAENIALENLTEEELEQRNAQMNQSLEDELAAYRQALSGASGEDPRKVSPNKFFDEYNQEQEIEEISLDGAIPEPKRAKRAVKSMEKAAQLYGANPYNLPIIPEPSTRQVSTIRTLEDFDVSMFKPAEKKVRIPTNVKPTFRASDFPELNILSMVPGRGIIAHTNGQEGVLLIGEQLDGWELLEVESGYAEFYNGKRKHVVRAGN